MLLMPMALTGDEPIGSMGTDTALAVLSSKPRLLYDYFKQLFAQEPLLDAFREEGHVDGSDDWRGRQLEPGPEACRQSIKVDFPGPFITTRSRSPPPAGLAVPFDDTAVVVWHRGRRAAGGAMSSCAARPASPSKPALAPLILSDCGVDSHHAPIRLLAVAGVHHHLVREGTRHKCGLQTGEARRGADHIALLLGFERGR